MPDGLSGRPLLIVDIDGVLNPYVGPSCPEGYVAHRLFGDDERVCICAQHATWLRQLADRYDLAWGTAWTADERALLGTVLDLPPFVAAAQMPPAPFEPAMKIPAIEHIAAGRPLAWIDDMLTPEAWAWAEVRPAPTFLLPIDPATGLAGQHVARLLDWSHEVDAEGAER